MGSDRRRRAITGVTALCALAIAFLAGGAPARAANAWWTPVGLQGVSVTRVSAIGDTITVRTGSGAMLTSTDAGRTFAAAPAGTTFPPTGVVAIGSQRWEIDPAGRVMHVANASQASAAVLDPGSPDLGAGADLIAAPAAFPGVVVAVGTDGVVWRRGQDGDWKEALLLLPASLVQGVPQVTSVTAFTQPFTGAIYASTAGYAVLISTDGGDDWIRAGPGLPELRLLALGRPHLGQPLARVRVRGHLRRALGARAPGIPGAPGISRRPAHLAVGRDRRDHARGIDRCAPRDGAAGAAAPPRLSRGAARTASASVAPWPTASPPSPVHTSCSTPITRWTGFRGGRRLSSVHGPRTGRCCCRSATAPVTGAT